MLLKLRFFAKAHLPTQKSEKLISGTAVLFRLCHDFCSLRSHRRQTVDPSMVNSPPSGDGGYMVIQLVPQWFREVET